MSMRVQFLDTIIQITNAELDQISETWAGKDMPLHEKARVRELKARLVKYEKQREYWRKAK